MGTDEVDAMCSVHMTQTKRRTGMAAAAATTTEEPLTVLCNRLVKQGLADADIPRVHAAVTAALEPLRSLATDTNLFIQVKVNGVTLLECRRKGPFIVRPALKLTDAEETKYGDTLFVPGRRFDTGDEVSVLHPELSVSGEHLAIAYASGKWGLATFGTVIGYLVPVEAAAA